MAELSAEVASFARLDARWVLPLGYEVTAVRAATVAPTGVAVPELASASRGAR
jgi:hypothetical protein